MKLMSFCSWAWLAMACWLKLEGWFFCRNQTQEASYCILMFLVNRIFLVDLRLDSRLSQAGKRG
jgi:hypothetical protein